MRPLLFRLIAGLLCAVLCWAALHFPFNKAALAAALLGYGVLLWHRPHAWLLVVPALLPVLDLAPWTGWFFLDELDLLLLTTAVFGYARIGTDDCLAELPAYFALPLGLVMASAAASTVIGLLPLPALDANAFSTYLSHFNSLRVAKGFAWAMLLLPLARRAAGPDLAGLRRYFIPGMLLGLAGASLAVAWERALFPGLLNFASDYRPTAPFSAMHTGGAALDAYLALSFPFLAAWMLGSESRPRQFLALPLALLGCYAGLTTFSRDMYLAYGTSGAVLLALLLVRRARQGRLGGAALLGGAAAIALLAFSLHQVFVSAGYRGLACALVLMLATFVVAGAPARLPGPTLTGAVALVLTALTGLCTLLFHKGAYLGFGAAALAFGAGAALLLARRAALAARGMALAAGALPALALGSVLVARHWGGSDATTAAACLAAVAAAWLVASRWRAAPLVRVTRNSLVAAGMCAIAFATVIPVSSSYYLGSRFATVGDDFSVRLGHWREALDIMNPDLGTALLGMGLGRYPETYAARNERGEMAGAITYEQQAGNLFVRLAAPSYTIGYGEVLRLLQHVDVEGGKRYRLRVDVRLAHASDGVAIALCERWLLYPQNCINAALRQAGGGAGWSRYEAEVNIPASGARWPLTPPVQLEISVQGAGALVDVDNLSLREAGNGAELLRNGAFTDANDNWFFSSDRSHFPWHVKNFVVNTFFEQGWAGLVAVALLLLFLCTDLIARALRGENGAAVSLAAIAGFLVVGMFDSLFDVPRLTLLFLLVASTAAMRAGRARPHADASVRRRRVRRMSAEALQSVEGDPVQAANSSNAP